jgi:hypothetical protein
MNSIPKRLSVFGVALVMCVLGFGTTVPAKAEATAKAGAERAKLGVIKGVVRDRSGNPIANATVAVFRAGTSKLLKQVTSTKSGNFIARLIPGTYTILAIAQGYNPVTLKEVTVSGASELVYGFNLERAGSGNTLPEKRADRFSGRTAIRAAQRSIYQAGDGEVPDAVAAGSENVLAPQGGSVDQTIAEAEDDRETGRRGQTVVETYFASGRDGNFSGVNFATSRPVGKNAEFIVAGQTGIGPNAPQRLQTIFSFNAGDQHRVRVKGSIANLGNVANGKQQEEGLGQISLQALDQWKVREGVILVVGVDYSRFIGAGDDYSLTPRLGFQYDLGSKTRVRGSYTTHSEQRTWQRVIELESSQVLFSEPIAVQDIPLDENKPKMNKSTRLEFGVERVLDNRSTVEASVFFDSVLGRGVGLESLPFSAFGSDSFNDFVAEQQGKSMGLRVVFNRRLNGILSTSAGYAYGTGQKLSDDTITNPANLFKDDVFQTFFGQVKADMKTGTSVRTVFRLSPRATVFAIDPFEGRLAIYDPSLSVLVTQDLPSWGLPIDAEAILDARNLFDVHTGVSGEEGALLLNSQRRMFRGGILVRF